MPFLNFGVKIDNGDAKGKFKSLESMWKKTTDSMKKESSKLKESADGVASAFGKSAESINFFGVSINKNMGTVAAFSVAMAGVVLEAHRLAGAADEVWKASQRLSLSVEMYQKFDSAAQHAGTSMSTFVTAQRKLIMNMAELERGSKRAEGIFASVTTPLKDVNGAYRAQEDILSDLLVELAGMEDVTQRNIIAQELLGRQANQLNPLLNEGAENVRNYFEGAEEAVVVTVELAKSAEKYNDQLQTMNEIFRGELNEAMEPIVEMFGEMYENLNDTGTVEYWGEVVATVIKGIATGLIGVIEVANIVGTTLDASVGTVITGITASLATLGTVLEGYAAIPSVISEAMGKGETELYAKLRAMNNNLKAMTVKSAKGVGESVSNGFERAVIAGEALEELWNDTDDALGKIEKAGAGVGSTLEETGKKAKNLTSTFKGESADWLNIVAEAQRMIHEQEIAGANKRFAARKEALGKSIADRAKKELDATVKLAQDMAKVRLDETRDMIDLQNEISIWQQENELKEQEQRKQNIIDFSTFAVSATSDMIGSISDLRQAEDAAEIASWDKKENARIRAMGLSARREKQLLDRQAEERAQREKEAAEEAKGAAIAQIWMDTAVGITKVWSQAGLNIPLGALQSGFLLANAGVQTATVNAQHFAEGGIVQNTRGFGVDKEPAMLTEREAVLTMSDQKSLFDMIRGGGGAGINITGGDIIVQGSADRSTVRAINQANDDFLFKIKGAIRQLQARGEIA